MNVLLAVMDFMTQLLLVLVGASSCSRPGDAGRQRPPGRRAQWKDFVLAIPIGMLAYTGIETVSNMSEEAKDESHTIPAAINRVRIAVFAIYFTLPAVALSAMPVTQTRTATTTTKLGLPEEQGGFAGDPMLGVVKQIDLGSFQKPAEIYVGLLAATILFLATNAGIIGVSRLVYSMGIHRQMPDGLRRLHPQLPHAVDRHPRLLGLGDPRHAARPGDVPRQRLLVRRAAVVHDRARVGDPPAHQAAGLRRARTAGRATSGSAATTRRCSRSPAARSRRSPSWSSSRCNPTWPPSASAGWCSASLVYVAFRRRHGLDLTSTHKVAIPQPVVDHEAEYDSVLVPLGDGLRRARDGHRGQARRPQAARHPRARARHRAERAADRRADGGRGGRRHSLIEQAQGPGRPARLRPRRADPRRAGGAADRRGGAATCARPRS